jgi:hypothetical protein
MDDLNVIKAAVSDAEPTGHFIIFAHFAARALA